MRYHRYLAWLVAFVALAASAAGAVELPPVETLQSRMATAPQSISVYEPHLSVGDAHVVVEYLGYPAVDVMAAIFGVNWREQAATIEFRALDGYVSRIDASRLRPGQQAFIVFARTDRSAFSVDNIAQNQTAVPLGPYYLVWDNISNPELIAEGARDWPYQISEIKLVDRSAAALLPAGLDARFHEGAELAKAHCLNCHQVNGFGGEKFDGDLAEIASRYTEPEFVRWVLAPASIRDGTTMPALSARMSEVERRRIAKSLFDYLTHVPALP